MKTLGALFTLTLFTATACGGGLVTTASESIEPEEPHDAWVDANGVEVVGAFGASATDLFYEDEATNIWRLDASTGLVSVTGYMINPSRYISSDCSGPAYMVGQFPPPRYTFTAPRMKGDAAKVIRVLSDDQMPQNIKVCSAASDTGCTVATATFCATAYEGIPESATLPSPALVLPVLVLTPPLHFERAVVNVD